MSSTLTLEDVERLGGTKVDLSVVWFAHSCPFGVQEEFEALGKVESTSEMEFDADGEEGEEDLQRTEVYRKRRITAHYWLPL